MNVELYHDDCFCRLQKFVKDNRIFDAIIADIPYNINYAEWDSVFNLEKLLPFLKSVLKSSGNLIIFNGWSNVCKTKELLDQYFIIQDWIIYDRIKGRGAKKHLVSTREDILWYSNGKDYTFNKIPSNIKKKTGGLGMKNGTPYRALSNVWTDISLVVPWSKERVDHPTQKPIQLMERCVKLWTNENDTVLDFTMGSGTTGIACKNLNRNFVGIEINKNYFDMAEMRINRGY